MFQVKDSILLLFILKDVKIILNIQKITIEILQVGLNECKCKHAGFSWVELNWVELSWAELSWVELSWILFQFCSGSEFLAVIFLSSREDDDDGHWWWDLNNSSVYFKLFKYKNSTLKTHFVIALL